MGGCLLAAGPGRGKRHIPQISSGIEREEISNSQPCNRNLSLVSNACLASYSILIIVVPSPHINQHFVEQRYSICSMMLIRQQLSKISQNGREFLVLLESSRVAWIASSPVVIMYLSIAIHTSKKKMPQVVWSQNATPFNTWLNIEKNKKVM